MSTKGVISYRDFQREVIYPSDLGVWRWPILAHVTHLSWWYMHVKRTCLACWAHVMHVISTIDARFKAFPCFCMPIFRWSRLDINSLTSFDRGFRWCQSNQIYYMIDILGKYMLLLILRASCQYKSVMILVGNDFIRYKNFSRKILKSFF